MFAVLGMASAFAASQDLPTQNPDFRSDTRLVQINAIVRDKAGPVSSLTKDDFTLTDKGRPQTIKVFSVARAGAPRGVPPLPANTFSNRSHGGDAGSSVTIVLLDRLNTLSAAGSDAYENHSSAFEDHALGYAKQKLMEFVKEMDSRDQVALFSLAGSLSMLSDFTNNRDQLQRILTAYRATSITDREKVAPGTVHTPVPGDFNATVDRDRQTLAGFTNADRAQTTIAALMAIAHYAADIPGRKNLVWLTANLPFPASAAARVLSRANIAVYPVDARGLVTRGSAPSSFDEASVIPGGPHVGAEVPGQGTRPPGIDSMEDLAAETGGRAFHDTNNLSEAIHKAVDDSAVTYTLGFYPESQTLDDKFHELKVRIRHSGYEVRCPKGYFALKDIPVSDAQQQNALQEAILSPLVSSAIRVQARIERANQPTPGWLTLAGTVELRDLQLSDAGEGAVDVYVVQQDATGKILGRSKNRINLQLTRDLYTAYLKAGIAFRESVEAKEGLVTVRLLVSDAARAQVGSLIIPVSEVK